MAAAHAIRRRAMPFQSGSFLLEALIAILIVSLGVLGIVGLYARSMQNVDDSKYRGEAALLASTLIGQMWVSDPDNAALTANYDSGSGGPGYTEFAALVAQRIPDSVRADGDVDGRPAQYEQFQRAGHDPVEASRRRERPHAT